MALVRATKKQKKLRLALVGPAGSGKSYSALAIGTALGSCAVFDSENNSASLYSDKFDFLTLDPPPTDFSPDQYIKFLRDCEANGIEVAILDGISAAWGKVLEMVDTAAKRYKGNSFAAWKDVAPEQNALIQEIINCKVHVIATMRTKVEWIIEEDKNGRKQPKKVGLAPVQRADLDYEFDVVFDIDHNNDAVVSKTRCSDLTGKCFHKPGKDVADLLKSWLNSGAPDTSPRRTPEQLAQPATAGAATPPARHFDADEQTANAAALEISLTWTTPEEKAAWVAEVQSALKSGKISREDAVSLSKKSQERAASLASNGAAA